MGAVTNNSDVVLGNFNLVNVACFDGQRVAMFEQTIADAYVLRPGESATYGTTRPIDPTHCSSFAVYALGQPPAT